MYIKTELWVPKQSFLWNYVDEDRLWYVKEWKKETNSWCASGEWLYWANILIQMNLDIVFYRLFYW